MNNNVPIPGESTTPGISNVNKLDFDISKTTFEPFVKRSKLESIEYQIKNYDNKTIPYSKFIQAVDALLKMDQKFIPNDEQYAALLNESKFLLIQASAGTGKTETLIRKTFIRQFIYDIPCSQILGLAYTKKAASIMSGRYERLAEQYGLMDLRDTKFNTVHAYALKILTALYPQMKVITDSGVTIETYPDGYLDEDGFPNDPELVHKTLEGYVKDALKLMNAQYLENSSQEIVGILKTITEKFLFQAEADIEKGLDVDLERYIDTESIVYSNITETYKMSDILRIYKLVRDMRKEDGVVSYEEMLVRLFCFLKTINTIEDLNKFHNAELLRFYLELAEIYIDEYQDITPIQECIVCELLRINPKSRLICTGDVSQSIFSFSGATPELMMSFMDRYSKLGHASMTYLVENRRSYDEIVDIANHILKNQKMRFDVDMVGCKGKGGTVSTMVEGNGLYKDFIISDVMNRLKTQSKVGVSVIYRENKMARELLLEFTRKRIPMNYRGPNVFNIPEMSIFEQSVGMMLNPTNTALYPRVLPALFGVNYDTAVEVRKRVDAYNKDCPDKKAVFSNFLPRTDLIIGRLNSFKDAYRLFKANRVPSCLELIKDMIIDVEANKKKQKFNPQTLGQVVNFLSTYSSQRFFDEFARDKEWFKVNTNVTGGVGLSTIHVIKGDEAEKIYLLNVSDETFPKANALARMTEKQSESFLTEERNCLYVALTRAVKDLVVILDPKSLFGMEVMSYFYKSKENNI